MCLIIDFQSINWTGQAHEGSSYAAQKTLQMAWHRSEHARSKVNELERTKNQLLAAAANVIIWILLFSGSGLYFIYSPILCISDRFQLRLQGL